MGTEMNRVARVSPIRLAWLATFGLLAGACSKEPPPPSVVDFIENPRLLEATMVRCTENRSELRYSAECLNAREAVDRMAAREEVARRAELEAQSERKRQALRRAQEAAAEARARAEEAERLRREAEYLSQFGEVGGTVETVPGEESPAESGNGEAADPPVPEPPAGTNETEAARETAEEAAEPDDLQSVRDELRRRQQEQDDDNQQ